MFQMIESWNNRHEAWTLNVVTCHDFFICKNKNTVDATWRVVFKCINDACLSSEFFLDITCYFVFLWKYKQTSKINLCTCVETVQGGLNTSFRGIKN